MSYFEDDNETANALVKQVVDREISCIQANCFDLLLFAACFFFSLYMFLKPAQFCLPFALFSFIYVLSVLMEFHHYHFRITVRSC